MPHLTSRGRSNLAVLLACLVFLVGGCASDPSGAEAIDQRFDEFAQRVGDAIEDPQRAATVRAALRRTQADFSQRIKRLEDKRHILREAARAYATTEEELEARLTDVRTEGQAAVTVLREGALELRELTTREEWNEILAPDKVLGVF